MKIPRSIPVLLTAAILMLACADRPSPYLSIYKDVHGFGQYDSWQARAIPHGLIPDTLKCEIAMNRSMYMKSNGIGLQYELLKKFGKWAGAKMDIRPYENDSTHWENLLNGNTDILVLNMDIDTLPKRIADNVITGKNDDGIKGNFYITMKGNSRIMELLNYWNSAYLSGNEYPALYRKYMTDYNRKRRKLSQISPYDEIIKEQSSKYLGWDWKIIAAIIQKESRFFMGVESSKGATGLMQIRPNIAQAYGIDNIFDPEQNIHAGTLYLKDISDRLSDNGLEGEELIKFTLASFNAGEARIRDCRNFTKSLGLDPDSWNDVEKSIPLMNLREYYTTDAIRLGRFNGKETINYVREVMETYRLYCSVFS